MSEQIEHFLANLFELQPEVHEHLGRYAFLLSQQSKQNMLGADVVVVQVSGLLHRIFDDLFCARRLGQLAHGDHVGAALDELLDFEPDLSQVDVEVLEHVGRHAAAFLDQAQQDVLRPNIFMVEPLRFLVRKLHYFSRAVGKSFVHRTSPFTFCRWPHYGPLENASSLR